MLGATALVLGLALMLPGRLGAEESPAEEAKPFRYEPGERRDPFVSLIREGRMVPTTSGTQTDTALVLHGVVWDPSGQSIALINDVEVKVGEMVGNYRLMEIRKDAVVLSDGGEPLVLQITFEPPPGAASSPTTTRGGRP